MRYVLTVDARRRDGMRHNARVTHSHRNGNGINCCQAHAGRHSEADIRRWRSTTISPISSTIQSSTGYGRDSDWDTDTTLKMCQTQQPFTGSIVRGGLRVVTHWFFRLHDGISTLTNTAPDWQLHMRWEAERAMGWPVFSKSPSLTNRLVGMAPEAGSGWTGC